MDFLGWIQRKLRWDGIQNLPIIIVATQGIIYLWLMVNPDQWRELVLIPSRVVDANEYWRLITFLFLVPIKNVIFTFFFLYLQYIYGTQLEEEWGSFKFTVFYGLGALGTIVAAFFFGGAGGAIFLNTSIFLAFAALFPNFELYLFFILRVKVKWIAVFTWGLYAFSFFTGSNSVRMAILVSLINYFLFFGREHYDQIKAFYRRQKFKRTFSGDD